MVSVSLFRCRFSNLSNPKYAKIKLDISLWMNRAVRWCVSNNGVFSIRFNFNSVRKHGCLRWALDCVLCEVSREDNLSWWKKCTNYWTINHPPNLLLILIKIIFKYFVIVGISKKYWNLVFNFFCLEKLKRNTRRYFFAYWKKVYSKLEN